MTFADWQTLKPAEAAQLIHRKVDALPPAQRRAVFAHLESEEDIAARLSECPAAAPLGRLPCMLKDVFDIGGWPTRAGSSFLAEVRAVPAVDGALAQTVRSLGAVIAGKTHLYEFAYGLTGENVHYGDVEHPRFPGRTSGGSSSGSAAAVAAGVVPLAFGTDTAGSIRVPAAFCGLFGFRMTPHHPWISDAFPLSPSFDTAGWFTANAGDMAGVLGALLGLHEDSRGLRGAWLELPGSDEVVASAQRAAAARFASPLEESQAGRLRDAFEDSPAAFSTLRAPEAWAVHAAWAESMASRYSPAVYERLSAGRKSTLAAKSAAEAVNARLRALLSLLWTAYDFLVLPATPCVAPSAGGCTQAVRDRILRFTAPISLAGLPVLSIPIALPGGLSTGLQIVAPRLDSPAFLQVLKTLR